ncbi:hypothetical protein ACFLQ4_00695, partial [Bacteroidota bacterium]
HNNCPDLNNFNPNQIPALFPGKSENIAGEFFQNLLPVVAVQKNFSNIVHRHQLQMCLKNSNQSQV